MYRNLRVNPDTGGDLFELLLKAIHPSERHSVAAEFSLFRSRLGPMRIEAGLAWAGDEPHWIVFLGRTFAGTEDGGPERMLGITIDSTRRRKRKKQVPRRYRRASRGCGS
jgi:hypothetical protein